MCELTRRSQRRLRRYWSETELMRYCTSENEEMHVSNCVCCVKYPPKRGRKMETFLPISSTCNLENCILQGVPTTALFFHQHPQVTLYRFGGETSQESYWKPAKVTTGKSRCFPASKHSDIHKSQSDKSVKYE